MTAAMGRVHQYGDRRLPAPGVIGILAAVTAAAAAAAAGSAASAVAAGIALIALLTWLGLYLLVAAPINRALTTAAIAHVTPGNVRALQLRWDSIITARGAADGGRRRRAGCQCRHALTPVTGREPEITPPPAPGLFPVPADRGKPCLPQTSAMRSLD